MDYITEDVTACIKNSDVTRLSSRVVRFCSLHAVSSSVIYYSTHTHKNVIYLLYICWHSLTETQLRFTFFKVTHRTRTAFTAFFVCYDFTCFTVFLSTCRYKNILLLKLGFIFTQKVQFVKCQLKEIDVKFALV